MTGNTSRAMRMYPSSLRLHPRSHSSSGVVRKSPPLIAPALLTRMSRRPRRAAASAATRVTAGGSPRSAAMTSTAFPVAVSIPLAASRSALASREQIATRAPSAASPCATARPIPLLPPVTSAVLPFSPSSMVSLDLHRVGPLRSMHLASVTNGVSREQLVKAVDGQRRRPRASFGILAEGFRHVGLPFSPPAEQPPDVCRCPRRTSQEEDRVCRTRGLVHGARAPLIERDPGHGDAVGRSHARSQGFFAGQRLDVLESRPIV